MTGQNDNGTDNQKYYNVFADMAEVAQPLSFEDQVAVDAVVAAVRAEYETDLCNTVNGTDDPARLSYMKCRLPAGHDGWHMDLGGVFSG